MTEYNIEVFGAGLLKIPEIGEIQRFNLYGSEDSPLILIYHQSRGSKLIVVTEGSNERPVAIPEGGSQVFSRPSDPLKPAFKISHGGSIALR